LAGSCKRWRATDSVLAVSQVIRGKLFSAVIGSTVLHRLLSRASSTDKGVSSVKQEESKSDIGAVVVGKSGCTQPLELKGLILQYKIHDKRFLVVFVFSFCFYSAMIGLDSSCCTAEAHRHSAFFTMNSVDQTELWEGYTIGIPLEAACPQIIGLRDTRREVLRGNHHAAQTVSSRRCDALVIKFAPALPDEV